MRWIPPMNWNGWARFSSSYSESVKEVLDLQRKTKTKNHKKRKTKKLK